MNDIATELAPTQVFLDGKVELRPGDCRHVIRAMPDNSIDSVVCDPPYALVSIVKRFGGPNAAPANDNDVYARASSGFMGKQWDTGETAFATEFWSEVLRVLKPGGHVVAFSGTRTYHRMAVAIEDAGFEIRDDILEMFATDRNAELFLNSLNDEQRSAFSALVDDTQFTGLLGWAYGSGFPKSHDVSKGIDKAAGAVREKVRDINPRNPKATGGGRDGAEGATRPWIEKAMELGYHEKDGNEPATEAAIKWQGWGTALKPAWEPICLARKPLIGTVAANVLEHGTGALNIDGCRVGTEGGTAFGRSADKSTTDSVGGYLNAKAGTPIDAGRWPANIVHDGSDEVLAGFPETVGKVGMTQHGSGTNKVYGDFARSEQSLVNDGVTDAGSAARFFYTAKADKLDRIGSKHPTVKPVDLMQWLCRMVTPPGGIVLDPFAGSGSTGEAAWREGFHCILIEREEEYQADIAARLRLADKGPATRKARAIKQAANDNDLPLFAPATPVAGAA